MDDPLHELENELKALRPRRPSVLLRARVERDLAASAPAAPSAAAPAPRYTTATSLRSWKWISWQLAAAASVALAVSLGVWRWQAAGSDPASATPALAQAASAAPAGTPVQSPSRSEPHGPARDGERLLASATPDVYRPVKAANLLYDLQDEGPVLLEDNTPGRRVRARYVDTYTWKNPATNASVKWSVPREEVRVLPTHYH